MKRKEKTKGKYRIGVQYLGQAVGKCAPKIIHFDQSAFVKGRTIFDAIRTIDDVIEHTMNRDISGILAAIDFEKTFDLSRKDVWI